MHIFELPVRGFNRLLQLDDEVRGRFAALSGRVIALELKRTGMRTLFSISADGTFALVDEAARPDVTVRTTVSGMLQQLRPGAAAAGPPPDVEISGDLSLAQEIQGLVHEIDPDWEELLSHWVGDLAAHNIGRGVRASGRYATGTGASLAASIGEFLKYERDFLPDRSEVGEFNDAVDTLREDVDRLQARVALLRRSLRGGT